MPQKALLATRDVYLCASHIGRVLAVAELMDPFVDPSDSAVEGWARDELYGRQLVRVAEVWGARMDTFWISHSSTAARSQDMVSGTYNHRLDEMVISADARVL